MRFAINLPNFGDLADPNQMVDLAVTAENAGWDGFFVWDHIVIADGVPVADPWVLLAAIGQATDRIVIGPMVTPMPRRRPWVLARQAASLQQLTRGRTVLGVGIGFPPQEEFGTFGEPTDERIRADMLDEGLEVVRGIWSGEPFAHEGQHYRVAVETRFAPVPADRIPIWVAGMWPHRRPMRRAARFDGVFPISADMSMLSPEEVAEIVAYVSEHRSTSDEFDVVIGGPSTDVDLAAYRHAGVTWYQMTPELPSEERRQMIAAGPPRLD